MYGKDSSMSAQILIHNADIMWAADNRGQIKQLQKEYDDITATSNEGYGVSIQQ